MIGINKSLHGAKGKIKAVYLGTTPVVIYLGDQLLYDVDLDGEYVLMDIQDGDTVDSTIEAPVKSAIVKGNTLVNIIDNNNWIQNSTDKLFTQNINIKQGSTYTVIGKIEYSDIYANENTNPAFRICTGTDSSGTSLFFMQKNNGIIKQTFVNNENSTIHVRFYNQQTNYKKLMIIEGDQTALDIPYFKGMKSVNNHYPIMNRVTSQGFGGASNIYESYFDNNQPFNAGETFTVFVVNPNISIVLIGLFNLDGIWFDNESIQIPNNKKFTYTVPESKMCKFVAVYVENSYDSTGFENSLVVLEGCQTHLDIDTYFEGAEDMKSFKKSILTITGKNLFNKKDVEFNYGVGNSATISNDYVSSNFIKVKPSTQYAINNSLSVVYGFDINKKMIGNIKNDSGSGTFITPNNCYFIRIRNYDRTTDHQSLIDAAQLEMGSSVTSYEPFKSNILSTLENLELRGVGEVKDELNLLTGEVTKYFDEVILDGSDDEKFIYIHDYSNNDVALFEWQNYFDYNLDILKRQGNMISDKFSVNSDFLNPTKEGLYCQFRHLDIMIDKSKLSELTTLGIQTYLKQNPIKMILPKQKSIKTVVLNIQDQDNKTILTLNTFNDITHFTVQGEDGKLQPVVSMEIACNPSQAISELSDKTEQLQQEQQELTEQVEQQELDTNNLQTATTDLEEV